MSDRTFVTGFGPFKNISENPSSTLASISGRPFQVLKVAYTAVDDFLAGLNPNSFDRLLMLGVAVNRDRLTPELFARNMIGKSPDMRGHASLGYIKVGAPLRLGSTLWTPEIVSTIVAYDPLTKISMDAGDYLCNYIGYRALERFPDKQVGFLHVPSQERVPIDQQAASLKRILDLVEA
jgi:pyrrolidone-carboxylate peptidase